MTGGPGQALERHADDLFPAAIEVAIRTVGQAFRVADAELRLAEAEARDAVAARQALQRRMALVERAIIADAENQAELWRSCVPALVAALTHAGSGAEAVEVVDELAARLGLGDARAFRENDEFERWVADDAAGLSFGATEPVTASGPAPTDLVQLGAVVEPPVTAGDLRRLRELTADPSVLAVSPFAGLHVSVPRRGGAYRHHGVLVGDGTVVHFTGEPLAQRGCSVAHTSFTEFVKDSDPGELLQHFPQWRGMDPVPCLLPNLVALRALHVVGAGDYSLFGRNCEHFGTWAQCSAMLSGQVDQLWRSGQIAAARRADPALGQVVEAYLDAWHMAVDGIPLGTVPPDAEPRSSSSLLDIGRIRWCADTQTFCWYLPLWGSADPDRLSTPPAGPRDRPWSLDPASSTEPWHTTAPSIRLWPSWHAAVLADADGRVFTLEQDGTCRRTSIDLHAIVERRAASILAFNQTLANRHSFFEARDESAGEPPTLDPAARPELPSSGPSTTFGADD